MKNLLLIVIAITVDILTMGCQRSSTAAVLPASANTTVGGTDEAKTFRTAVERLAKDNYIPMIDNGRCGWSNFQQCFGEIFLLGCVADFEKMCAHENPVVRAMGLLCLKYADLDKARSMKDRLLDDRQEVLCVRGCFASERPMGDIASKIFWDHDFCDTKCTADRITAERKGLPFQDNVADTNDAVITIH